MIQIRKAFYIPSSKLDLVNSETGDISGTFRSRRSSIDSKIQKVQSRLKDLTSNRKTSVNQTLNFSVILADKFLEVHDDKVEELESEIRDKENEIEELDQVLQRAIEF